MEIFVSFFHILQKTFFSLGPFFLLLGVLIFIHELGHFLVARFFGVKVEVFSLGFGPKVLKYKKGDTIYCLSLLPLGGYVKMFGDDPRKNISPEERPKGFLYKKVYQKWLIAFGGPFMNLLFAALGFLILSITGIPSYPPELGDIKSESLAYKSGFRSGDQVLSVNGKTVSYYEELDNIIKSKIGEELVFKVQSRNGEIKILKVTTSLAKNPNPLEIKKFIGAIDGLSFLSAGLRVGIIHGSQAYETGLRTFDEITKVNGKEFRYWRDVEAFVKNIEKKPLSITVKRETEIKQFTINQPFSSLTRLGIEQAYLYIDRIGSGTPAEQAGLLKGDRLVSIDGKPIQSWEQVLETIGSYSGRAFSIVYRRQGKHETATISPKSLFVEGNVKKRFMLGIVSAGLTVLPEQNLRKRPILKSFIYSERETRKWLGFITTGLVRLVQGEISLRTMGGPIAIGRAAHSSFHQGFQSFLFMMALISLNLFFINLLPIPMLDGGHLLFFTIEGFLGRPLSIKKLVVAQHTGFMLLLSFLGLVLFNDIYNWFKAW